MERDGGGRGMRYVPSWTALEEAAREELKRSGLTSSDDAPRYRRGSKRPPRPPKTPPGLLRPPHDAVQRARFAGRGRGWAAIREIPAATVLFQERPLVIAGAFDADEDALREMTRVLVTDPSHASTWLRRVDGVSLSTSTDSPTRRAHSSASESSPIDGVDDASWNDARAFVRRRAAVRRSRVDANDEAAETAAAPAGRSASDASTDDDAGGDEGDGSSSSSSEDRRAGGKGKGRRARFVVTLFANASAINHACAPNAAVAVAGEDVATAYALRAIEPGEEITVSYAPSSLYLPLTMRRMALSRRWGFVCECERCARDAKRAALESERRAGTEPRRAARHGVRSRGFSLPGDEREDFHEWERGETGFEAQFDDEGRLRATLGGVSTDGRPSRGRSTKGGARRGGGGADGRGDTDDSDTSFESSSSYDSRSSSEASSSEEDDDVGVGGARRGSGVGRGGAAAPAKRARVKLLGPGRLYNKLVRAGIGPDHWQMHATREILVSKLLTKEGRKDFDLDLLLEHAHCASRLARNHPHAIRLVALVEEVFRSNRAVVRAEPSWVFTITLLRESVHPDVLFWNTEFKGFPNRDDDEAV